MRPRMRSAAMSTSSPTETGLHATRRTFLPQTAPGVTGILRVSLSVLLPLLPIREPIGRQDISQPLRFLATGLLVSEFEIVPARADPISNRVHGSLPSRQFVDLKENVGWVSVHERSDNPAPGGCGDFVWQLVLLHVQITPPQKAGQLVQPCAIPIALRHGSARLASRRAETPRTTRTVVRENSVYPWHFDGSGCERAAVLVATYSTSTRHIQGDPGGKRDAPLARRNAPYQGKKRVARSPPAVNASLSTA